MIVVSKVLIKQARLLRNVLHLRNKKEKINIEYIVREVCLITWEVFERQRARKKIFLGTLQSFEFKN